MPWRCFQMTKDNLSKTEQVPNPETQRGHGTLSAGPQRREPGLPGSSRTFLSFPKGAGCSVPPPGPQAEGKGPSTPPFPSLISPPLWHWHFLPWHRRNQNVCQPAAPLANRRPCPWLRDTWWGEGDGKYPSFPSLLQHKPSVRCLPQLYVSGWQWGEKKHRRNQEFWAQTPALIFIFWKALESFEYGFPHP